MDSIYFKSVLVSKVSLSPINLNHGNLDHILLERLRDMMEGKCHSYGYIRPNSIEILTRSAGYMPPDYFNGILIYKIKYSAEICNPNPGMVIECKVNNINKMGLLAGVSEDFQKSPLVVLVSKQHHKNKEIFTEIKVGTGISVEVIGKKYELHDKYISIVGTLHGESLIGPSGSEESMKTSGDTETDSEDSVSESEESAQDDSEGEASGSEGEASGSEAAEGGLEENSQGESGSESDEGEP